MINYEDSIKELGLSVRTYNLIKDKMKINTVAELVASVDDGSLLSLSGCGKKTYNEIISVLNNCDIITDPEKTVYKCILEHVIFKDNDDLAIFMSVTDQTSKRKYFYFVEYIDGIYYIYKENDNCPNINSDTMCLFDTIESKSICYANEIE